MYSPYSGFFLLCLFLITEFGIVLGHLNHLLAVLYGLLGLFCDSNLPILVAVLLKKIKLFHERDSDLECSCSFRMKMLRRMQSCEGLKNIKFNRKFIMINSLIC